MNQQMGLYGCELSDSFRQYLRQQFPEAVVCFRQLRPTDYDAFLAMDTGIPNDYIADIFPYSVDDEATYGLFINHHLVTMGAMTILANHYVILGRVRTDRRYRGLGLSTHCLRELISMAQQNPEYIWIGLATEASNTPMRTVAEHLPLQQFGAYQSCSLRAEDMEQLLHLVKEHDDSPHRQPLNQNDGSDHLQPKTGTTLPSPDPAYTGDALNINRHNILATDAHGEAADEDAHDTSSHNIIPWQRITDDRQKFALLNQVTPVSNTLSLFPYDCYYPLPYDQQIWTPAYLRRTYAFQSPTDPADFVTATEDAKGWPYLQVTYTGAHIFTKPGMWEAVIATARSLSYDIWLELPADLTLSDRLVSLLTVNHWTYYGRYL